MRKYSIANKFFLVFFSTSILVIFAIVLAIYFSIKNNIINYKTQQLEVLHNIKSKQLQDTFSHLQAPLLQFLKTNYKSYGYEKLASAYKNLSKDFTNNEINNCSNKLLQYNTSKYRNKKLLDVMNLTISDSIPANSNGIIAQCINIPYIKDANIEGININKKSIKTYMDYYEQSFASLEAFIDTEGFQSILFISSDNEIFFSSDKSSILGHNAITSSWIRGLSRELSKFNSMTTYGNQEYYFIDMQPYTVLYGYPAFFIIAPIFENNKYTGSIVLVLTSLFVDNILSNHNNWEYDGFGKTGDAYLTSAFGIYRSNKRQFLENTNPYLSALKSEKRDDRLYEMVKELNTVAYYSNLTGFQLDKNNVLEKGYKNSLTYNGKEIITYYAPVNIGNLTWILFVHMEMEEVLSNLNKIKTLLSSIMIPVIILIAFITFLFTYFMMRPIKQLNNTCKLITQGNKEYKDIKGTYKEINELIDSFDNMVSFMKTSEKQMKKVKKDLEDSILNKAVVSQELKEEKEFISKVLDSKGFIILIIDENDKIIHCNKDMLSIFPNMQIINEPYNVFLEAEYKTQASYILSLIRRGVTNIPHFVSSNTIDNRSIYIEWNFSSFTSRDLLDGHKSLFVTAIGIDITERFEAEKTSQEKEAMFHKIFSNAYDAILIADEENNILLVNKAFEILFDIDYVDLVGKPVISNIFPNEYKNVVSTDYQERSSMEIEALHSNKGRFTVELSISKVIYKGKVSILYILRDITLKKQKERELQASLNSAKNAEKTKSEFLANMSNEFKAPLNSIVGVIDLLNDTDLNEAQKEYIKMISNSSDILFNIINDILDFSTIESGKMQLENMVFNSWNIFEDSVDTYAKKAMDKNILLLCLFSADIPKYLIGDPIHIRQIITNLISNAIKFTNNNGFVVCRVNLVFYDGKSCKLRISVKDNGIGITKEQQKIIMEQFPKTNSYIKYGGTGLGIAITKNLINSMGSTLSLFSEYGNGSEFYFTLDLQVATKKDNYKKANFYNTNILLLGFEENSIEQDLYEEYFKNVYANVIYTTNIDDLDNNSIKIIAIIYDFNKEYFIKSIINKYHNKNFIIFNVSSDSKTTDIIASNVFYLKPPFTMSKLINILYNILGVNKSISIAEKKEKNATFKGKVLLVDDNDVNLTLSEILLKNLGIQVESASNGQVAIEKYKANKYDIIFMDIYMPVMDGIEATKEIIIYEKESNIIHTPIVALTADITEKDMDTYMSIGMDDFIAKPIVKAKLKAVLKRYLSNNMLIINENIITDVAKVLHTNDENEIYNAINEYGSRSWHYTQNLFYSVTEFNEGVSLFLIDKLLSLAEQYKFENITNILNKIKQNIENGINDNTFLLLDELKDNIYAIKYSIKALGK